jgi:hypothetical protein
MLVPLLLRKSQNDVLLLLSFSFMGQLLQKGDGLHRTLYPTGNQVLSKDSVSALGPER